MVSGGYTTCNSYHHGIPRQQSLRMPPKHQAVAQIVIGPRGSQASLSPGAAAQTPNTDSSGIASHNVTSRRSNPESEPFLILSLNHCLEQGESPSGAAGLGGRVCVWFSSRLVYAISLTCSVFLHFPPLYHIFVICSGALHSVGASLGVSMAEVELSLSGELASPLAIPQHGSSQWMASGTDAGGENSSSLRGPATNNLTRLQWIYRQHRIDFFCVWEVMGRGEQRKEDWEVSMNEWMIWDSQIINKKK